MTKPKTYCNNYNWIMILKQFLLGIIFMSAINTFSSSNYPALIELIIVIALLICYFLLFKEWFVNHMNLGGKNGNN